MTRRERGVGGGVMFLRVGWAGWAMLQRWALRRPSFFTFHCGMTAWAVVAAKGMDGPVVCTTAAPTQRG